MPAFLVLVKHWKQKPNNRRMEIFLLNEGPNFSSCSMCEFLKYHIEKQKPGTKECTQRFCFYEPEAGANYLL